MMNCDGIVQEVRRLRAAGARDLKQMFDVVEEVRLELDRDAEPFGRRGAVDAIQALPAFQGTPFPSARFAPAPARTVAAPPTRTR
jgi:hypothetical protein